MRRVHTCVVHTRVDPTHAPSPHMRHAQTCVVSTRALSTHASIQHMRRAHTCGMPKHASCPHMRCPHTRRSNTCAEPPHMRRAHTRADARAVPTPAPGASADVSWRRPAQAGSLLGGFGGELTDQSVMAAARVRQQYEERVSGKAPAAAADATQQPPARDLDGLDCPICCEPMAGGAGKASEPTAACGTCRNVVHSGCWDRWAAHKRTSHAPVTCVFCRAPWPEPNAANAAGGIGSGERPLCEGLSAASPTLALAATGVRGRWHRDRRGRRAVDVVTYRGSGKGLACGHASQLAPQDGRGDSSPFAWPPS
eukprot:361075-Chlamydomonas_euryale.AAC.2